ncbi:hypothetical protein Gogos_018933 [Gossypium gossypioides]|uniref:Uncharacterized protein n=1 Tax=Gossypium gossypioides TaxID=34282 RepID=A0A7J9BFV6_GOSGO|nr:hypothetical protein [Gossypium gossypioides]
MLLQSFLRRQPPSSPLESSPISSLSASPTMVGFISYESSKCCGFEQALTLVCDWKSSAFSYCSSRPQIPPMCFETISGETEIEEVGEDLRGEDGG